MCTNDLYSSEEVRRGNRGALTLDPGVPGRSRGAEESMSRRPIPATSSPKNFGIRALGLPRSRPREIPVLAPGGQLRGHLIAKFFGDDLNAAHAKPPKGKGLDRGTFPKRSQIQQ